MKPILLAGTIIVNLALVFYTISFLKLKKNRQLSASTMKIQFLGLTFDIIATICMIIGSSNSPFSLHGIVGYSSLTIMLIHTYMLFKLIKGSNETIILPSKYNLFMYLAYFWWIAAYVTGLLIVIIKRIG